MREEQELKNAIQWIVGQVIGRYRINLIRQKAPDALVEYFNNEINRLREGFVNNLTKLIFKELQKEWLEKKGMWRENFYYTDIVNTIYEGKIRRYATTLCDYVFLSGVDKYV